MAELRHGPAPVTAPPVIEADPDLQDPLVEVANRVRLVDPDALERLVLLEELLPVELVDAVEQSTWRGGVAAAGAARGVVLCGRALPGGGGERVWPGDCGLRR